LLAALLHNRLLDLNGKNDHINRKEKRAMKVKTNVKAGASGGMDPTRS
jgi:hypothetical protein